MSFHKTLEQYKQNEIMAHVELDDIIIKVTQEIWEMLEAKLNNNRLEVKKEAWDAIVNILSASAWINILPDEKYIYNRKTVSNEELFLNMKSRIQSIQAIRKRYSRDNIDKEEFQRITEIFISHVLSYWWVKKTLEEILKVNSIKFADRINSYKPDVNLKDYVNEYQDFPKAPVSFKDISPLLQSPETMRYITFEFAEKAQWADVIVWLDARWFLFWPMLAEMLWIPFVMIRKKWKLPWETINQEYSKEYWIDIMEIQKDKILPWQKIVLIDDLLATWWTMDAAWKLIEKLWWNVHKILSVVQIDDEFCTQMREKYNLSRYQIESLVNYEK